MMSSKRTGIIIISFHYLLLIFTLSAEVCAFAAGKKGNGNRKGNVSGGGNKGFGSSPSKKPSAENIIATFKTRLPFNSDAYPCPCGTGKMYKTCCGPFHRKDILPSSPLEVLRSRYTAYFWRLPLYIMDTTHPSCGDYMKDRLKWANHLNREGMFDSYDFVSFEHGPEEISDDGTEGFVDFKVSLRANGMIDPEFFGNELAVRERSRFVCEDNVTWKYASGDVTADVDGLEDVVLNK
mmetsp:Transcript_1238/g.1329  ORF Transcript_1238/g.1329 Transcript_1238/m.1329 type:complete len:237 (-) Transcript_1238:62-772(-)|eukprot:CAMPEP_0198248914 /NCGR_PEP_ID=MMETSP1447-20131203/567_1 /TAXON_ID=420782 /ORGANISM="Chaetoceros dichaeta, Strain CCMP1751" /LENGTH=236 /DNA_ID=CAMNT_0043933411 /DNA_START=52 /DNA_END=762 /DNA_ORIENTATION=+